MNSLDVPEADHSRSNGKEKLLWPCAVLLLALGLSAPAYAADEESAGNAAQQLADTAQADDELLALFEELDADDNGTISLEEAKEETNLHANYKDADINTDGRLNKTEFSSFQSQQGVSPSDVSND